MPECNTSVNDDVTRLDFSSVFLQSDLSCEYQSSFLHSPRTSFVQSPWSRLQFFLCSNKSFCFFYQSEGFVWASRWSVCRLVWKIIRASSLALWIFVQTLQRAMLLWGFLSAPGKGFPWVWACVPPPMCPVPLPLLWFCFLHVTLVAFRKLIVTL